MLYTSSQQADVSLNEEMMDDGVGDDISPIDPAASPVHPFERVLSVADFTSHFKSIGKSVYAQLHGDHCASRTF